MSGFKKATRKEFWNFRVEMMSILESGKKDREPHILKRVEKEFFGEKKNYFLDDEILIRRTDSDSSYRVCFEIYRNIFKIDENGDEIYIDKWEILHEFELSQEAIDQIPSGYNAVHNVSKWENIEILENEIWKNIKDFYSN